MKVAASLPQSPTPAGQQDDTENQEPKSEG